MAVLLAGLASATAARAQDSTGTDTSGTASQAVTGRVIQCEGGKIKTFDCQNVELLSFLPKSAIGESSGYDLWGWHDSTTGREFLAIGGKFTAFVEVTDPVNPRYLGVLPPHQGITKHTGQSVKVYGHYAFIGYEGVEHGIQIFDLAQLRDVTSPAEFKETAHYNSLANTHTIAVNPVTGFLYVNGSNTCGGGLHMIDVRTPTKPTFAGCYPETLGGTHAGYIHDAQCVVYRGPDRQHQGQEVCVNYAENGFGLVDVTDKQRLKAISSATYPNAAYTHQGWFSEDQRYIFIDDELDENGMPDAQRRTRTLVFDLQKLSDPVLATEFFNANSIPLTPFQFGVLADHNLYVRGHNMYQANYAAGLRVIDIADPKTPKEVGYLANIGSAWGTYPYFGKDVVAVSTETGLFLARLHKS